MWEQWRLIKKKKENTDTLDSTGRSMFRQTSQAVTKRRCSISTAFTKKKRLPAFHGWTFSWSSCTAVGGKTNTPSGSTYRKELECSGRFCIGSYLLQIRWVVTRSEQSIQARSEWFLLQRREDVERSKEGVERDSFNWQRSQREVYRSQKWGGVGKTLKRGVPQWNERGIGKSQRDKHARMRFNVQLLFALLWKAELFSGGELYPVL